MENSFQRSETEFFIGPKPPNQLEKIQHELAVTQQQNDKPEMEIESTSLILDGAQIDPPPHPVELNENCCSHFTKEPSASTEDSGFGTRQMTLDSLDEAAIENGIKPDSFDEG